MIESWTDLDYAQAAIDMLPGSVEEIEAFLSAQGIKSRWKKDVCPLDQWASRWTDWGTSTGFTLMRLKPGETLIPLPPAVLAYRRWVDSKGR